MAFSFAAHAAIFGHQKAGPRPEDQLAVRAPPGFFRVSDERSLPDAVRDLPLIVLPPSDPHVGALVIWISGDGGWGDLDAQVSERLARRGDAIVALNANLYFATEKPAEQVAHDLARIARTFSDRWGTRSTVVVGYSFGADVAPFAVEDWPNDAPRPQLVALLSPSGHVDFKRGVKTWLGIGAGPLVRPKIAALASRVRVMCVHGRHDPHTSCVDHEPAGIDDVALAGGHQFDFRWDRLATTLDAEIEIATGARAAPGSVAANAQATPQSN